MRLKTGIGQDHHRFAKPDATRPLILGGFTVPDAPGLDGNSDADVILHALTRAITSVSTVPMIGPRADRICLEEGILDSARYLEIALGELKPWRLTHVAISIEAGRPRLEPHILPIRESIASLTGLDATAVGLTATSGEGLTACGRGEGIAVVVAITAEAE